MGLVADLSTTPAIARCRNPGTHGLRVRTNRPSAMSNREPDVWGGQDRPETIHNCCQGGLIDISAGGLQVIVPYQKTTDSPSSEGYQQTPNKQDGWDEQKPNFKKGQFVGIRFTPMPYETPLTLSAQIRSILPTADNQGISLGLQIVGLEASTEGHQVLTRLIAVVGQYYQINQSGAKQLDKHTVTSMV